jgi:hypothetical protein
MGLQRGPLSPVSATEELRERKAANLVYETEITAAGIPCADHATLLYSQKLALTSPTSMAFSFGIVRSRTEATKLF